MKNFYLIIIQDNKGNIRLFQNKKMFAALNEFGWKPIMEKK